MQRLADLDPALLTARGLEALAADYVDRLRATGVADPYDFDPGSVPAGELAALFEDLALTAQRHPGFADLVVEGLGAEGVHAVVEGLVARADHWHYSYQGHASPFRSMLDSFATTVQVAARDGGVDQRILDDILAAPFGARNVALLLAAPTDASGAAHPWPTRFLVPAARTVFDVDTDFFRASHLDALSRELFDGDARQGALGALSESPEASWEFLGEDRLRAEVLFGVYNDGGAAAGAVLRAGLHDHVATSDDPVLLADARDRFDAIAELVYDHDEAGWFVFGRGDQLNTGAREGLAWAMLPHLDSIAVDLYGRRLGPPRTYLERTLAKVMADDDAAAVLAQGFGGYLAVRNHHAAAAAGSVKNEFVYQAGEFASRQRVGELVLLFLDAEGMAAGEQAARWGFFVAAGQTSANAAARVGVAAAPLSGGGSAVVGAGTSIAIGEAVKGIPAPSHDVRGVIDTHYDAFVLAAVRAIALDDNLARAVGIDPADRAHMANDEFIDDYVAYRQPAVDQYNALWRGNEDLRRLAGAMRREVMGSGVGRAGIGD